MISIEHLSMKSYTECFLRNLETNARTLPQLYKPKTQTLSEANTKKNMYNKSNMYLQTLEENHTEKKSR